MRGFASGSLEIFVNPQGIAWIRSDIQREPSGCGL
jgi:hypothetical protein